MIIVFPGQGSQLVGMGKDFHDNFSEAKEVFQEVDHVMNKNLTKIIFHGEAEELKQTSNTQPAIMATSVAILRVLLKALNTNINNIATHLAGHSLGEYTALYASGSLTLSENTYLLKTRGKATQDAVPKGIGGMVACLGGERGPISKMIEEANKIAFCAIANDNSQEQLVISGYTKAIDFIIEKHKEYTVKKVARLSVSTPFHCKLMEPAVEPMQQALSQISIKPMQIPVISNTLAKPFKQSQHISETLLQQLTQPVRWRESMLYASSQKGDTFLEIGPNNVLSKLIKKIDPSKNTISLGRVRELEANITSIEKAANNIKEYQ